MLKVFLCMITEVNILICMILIKILITLLINIIKNLKKKIYFYKSLKWYFVYVLYGLIGGMLINSVTNMPLIRYDMVFNILISPILYYHSPRNILTNIKPKQFWLFYTIPFILGLSFRFLDNIPELNSFIINPDYIQDKVQIILLVLLIIVILIISAYYIFISKFPKWCNFYNTTI